MRLSMFSPGMGWGRRDNPREMEIFENWESNSLTMESQMYVKMPLDVL